MPSELEEICADGYLDGLSEWPMADVRAIRDECQAVENGLSFARRMAHGRLDIVGGELTRRREGGDPHDLSELIGRLPDLLADESPATTVGSRSPRSLDLSPVSDDLARQLDDIVGSAALAGIVDRSTDELEVLTEQLLAFEAEVSDRRRTVQDRVDALHAEIARRYRDGEATTDDALRS